MSDSAVWIRQFMYGKKYFMQEFGKDIKTCWLPDAFGFPATLPQVYYVRPT